MVDQLGFEIQRARADRLIGTRVADDVEHDPLGECDGEGREAWHILAEGVPSSPSRTPATSQPRVPRITFGVETFWQLSASWPESALDRLKETPRFY
jgi:hypothetical protein